LTPASHRHYKIGLPVEGLSNETVLIEQYANNRGPGWGIRGQSPHEAETHLAFGRSMEAANLPAFLTFGDAKNHSYLQSA